MNNVLIIWSSPNREGLTASAKDAFMQGLGQTEYEEICLNRKNIRMCQACGNGWGTCRSEGTCVIQDDFAEIYEKMRKADGIVFVTAVYWHDMTKQIKAFLDRLRRCEARHNHYLAGKRCILVACAGGTGKGVLECLHNLEYTLGHMDMRAYDRIPVIRYNREYVLPMLTEAGRTYAERLVTGFDMKY